MLRFDEFVSLGGSCGTKYQIELNGFRRDHPAGSVDEFQQLLYSRQAPSLRGRSRHFFDWIVTPLSSMVRLVATDFRGVFQRKNLVITGRRAVVRDRVLGLSFMHDFQAAGPVLTEAELGRQFKFQRERYLYFRDKFLALARSDKRVMYLIAVSPTTPFFALTGFHDVMTARHPRHRYVLVAVRPSGAPDVAQDRVIIRKRTRREIRCEIHDTVDKPAGEAWSFDDTAWQCLLDRFDWA